jgi:hypothetical protein
MKKIGARNEIIYNYNFYAVYGNSGLGTVIVSWRQHGR